jgi:acyl-CoA reductase-like NAD-dependent aldehyde dehydrogenase
MNSYQQFNPRYGQLSAVRGRLNDQQFHPSVNLARGDFDTWWQKTFAQHAAVVAEAAALMRAHRRTSAASESHANEDY